MPITALPTMVPRPMTDYVSGMCMGSVDAGVDRGEGKYKTIVGDIRTVRNEDESQLKFVQEK